MRGPMRRETNLVRRIGNGSVERYSRNVIPFSDSVDPTLPASRATCR
jgi:hypothetical protein